MSQSVKLSNGSYIAQSYVGMIIFSTTLDSEEKVKRYYDGDKWEKIEGRFLLGAGNGYSNGVTGGEASHTLTNAELPNRAVLSLVNDSGSAKGISGINQSTTVTENNNYVLSCGTDAIASKISSWSTATNQAHNNMPPYKAVYIWERTA